MLLDGTLGPVIEITDPSISAPLLSNSTFKVAFDGQQWWTSWVEIGRGAVFARVSTNGNVLDFGGQPVVASSGNRPTNEHDLVGLASGGAQFVWHDNRAGAGLADIFAEQLEGNATSSTPVLLSSAARHQHFSDIAAGSSEFLTVFVSEISGEKRIVGQRLDTNGSPLDNTPFLIHTIAADASHSPPRVDFDGTRYLVVWSENGQILAKRVAINGSMIDAQPSAVMTGRSPDVSGLNGIFLVVGTEQVNSPQFYHPFSMRVDGANLNLLDAQPGITWPIFRALSARDIVRRTLVSDLAA